jgi:protein TonB
MDFARQQRDPTRHAIGIAFVVLIHILVIYALVTGLGSKAVQLIKKPLTATIIEEIKVPPPPPPPPLKKIVEPPKIKMQQPFVPPPDIPVVTPPPVEPVIAVVAPTPPPEPVVIAPPAPIAPPEPPKPAIRQGVSCKVMEKPSFPREAIRAGVEKGQVIAVLTIDDKGNVSNIDIVSAQPARVFDRVVRDTLGGWKCVAEGSSYKAKVEINFSLTD